MAIKNKADGQIQSWKELSLLLLLILGIVGAATYTLLLRQKERLDNQEVALTNLADTVNELVIDVQEEK